MPVRVDREDWRIWFAWLSLGLDGLVFFVWRDARHAAWMAIPALFACQGFMYWYYRHVCIPWLERIQADSAELASLYGKLFRVAMMVPAVMGIIAGLALPEAK